MTWIKRWGIGIAVSAALAAAPGVASATPEADFTWNGSQTGMTGPNWSLAGNWTPGEPTGTIGTLTFPELNATCSSPSTCYTGADDLGALSINKLVIDDTDGYFIENTNSSSLAIGDGGIEADATADNNGGGQASFTPPVTLTAAQTWTFGGVVSSGNGDEGQLELGNGVSGNEALTLTAPAGFAGTNGPVLALNGENENLDSEVGQVTVDNGVNLQLSLAADLNSTDADPIDITTGSELSVIDAPSETGPINITEGSLVLGAGESPDGSLTAGGAVTLDSSSNVHFFIDDNGSTPSTDYTQLSATGNISLGGSALSLRQGTAGGTTCNALTANDTATLISDTSGTISGTFASVPNGAIVSMPGCGSQGYPVQIAYTAHAVTATVLSPTTTITVSVPSSATVDKQVTLTATVTGAGAPTGTVAFSDAGGTISGCDSVTLTGVTATTATATCSTSFTSTGAHPITAQYGGSSDLTSSTSGVQTVQVSGGGSSPPPPAGSGTPKVTGAHVTATKTSSGAVQVSVPVSCAAGGASCTVKGALSTNETVYVRKSHKAKKKLKTISVGSATVTIQAGQSGRLMVKLNGAGRKLLAKHHKLRVKLTVTHRVNGKTKTLLAKVITLKR